MNKAQQFIKLKKRKRMIKRLGVASIILVIAIIIFIYKAPIFNVKKVIFTGITTLNEKELQECIKEYIGENIFILDYKEMKEKILENPYIKEVTINKKSTTILSISIEEGNVSYYLQDGETYKAITNEGFYVEELTTLEGRNLVNIVGAKDNGKGIGEKIIDDESISKILNEFYPIIKSDITDLRVEKIDITNTLYIKAYIRGVEILFGNSEDLVGKMNKALNILEQNNIEKGYIDVSFNGPAVIKIES